LNKLLKIWINISSLKRKKEDQ